MRPVATRKIHGIISSCNEISDSEKPIDSQRLTIIVIVRSGILEVCAEAAEKRCRVRQNYIFGFALLDLTT